MWQIFILHHVHVFQRLLGTDGPSSQAIEQEVSLSQQLSGHPNIVDFIGCNTISNSSTSHGKTEYQLLLELCTGMHCWNYAHVQWNFAHVHWNFAHVRTVGTLPRYTLSELCTLHRYALLELCTCTHCWNSAQVHTVRTMHIAQVCTIRTLHMYTLLELYTCTHCYNCTFVFLHHGKVNAVVNFFLCKHFWSLMHRLLYYGLHTMHNWPQFRCKRKTLSPSVIEYCDSW